ncbi:MAG TPA: hypothetical protein VGK73_04005 [Polyangiaceae bacterium]
MTFKRRVQRKTMPTRELVERAKREGYVLFRPTDGRGEELCRIMHRVMEPLTDINCFEGWTVFTCLSAFVAVYGAANEVDCMPALHREVYLKNCAEKFDAYAKQLAESKTEKEKVH